MIKGPSSTNSQVGDSKQPPLAATRYGLGTVVDQAQELQSAATPPVADRMKMEQLAAALVAANQRVGQPSTCKQTLWLSFFFDGTGNNMEADLALHKHSNIARLYRAHKPTDPSSGLCRVYVPGIGTYFPEVGDPGGTVYGAAFGAKGQARLDFAIAEFDNFLARPLMLAASPANAISSINIAVFGFSRGAALARAFMNLLVESRGAIDKDRWVLKNGRWPLRIRFAGLFDTVASVGEPMSGNNMDYVNPAMSDVAGMIEERLDDFAHTSPVSLAFAVGGKAGADPAPGSSNGHNEWGRKLKIDKRVEEVRHFVAAHEIRNSFPLDSVSIISAHRTIKPAHFYEVVYPGAHSDVGGGYAPGEGARSLSPSTSLSLIPLRHMYDCAVRCGVPMRSEWLAFNEEDFATHKELIDSYNYYMKSVGSHNTVGASFNKHMRMLLSWRFYNIRRKRSGDSAEAGLLKKYSDDFDRLRGGAEDKQKRLARDAELARLAVQEAIDNRGRPKSVPDRDSNPVKTARQQMQEANRKRDRAKSLVDAIPDMKSFASMLELYDDQLVRDAEQIIEALERGDTYHSESNLRPHYRALVETYRDEFYRNAGLRDEKIIAFFSQFVHDSLAGFARDATLPSDPRVIYAGGDEKIRFAVHIPDERASAAV